MAVASVAVHLLSLLLDVRRARQQRWTVVVLSGLALAMPPAAWAFPRATGYLCPPTLPSALLAGASLVIASAAAAWSGHEARWTAMDTAAWLVTLASLSVLASIGAAPLTLAALLYAFAALSLSIRVPPPRIVLAVILSAALAPVVRMLLGRSVDAVVASALFASVVSVSHVTGARATHSLAYVLAEREALLSERRSASRGRTQTPATSNRGKRSAGGGGAGTELSALPSGSSRSFDDVGWEGLVEKLRTSLGTLCESAGVAASVRADVQGLAVPSARMRTNVLRIAQEATHHALRETSPTAITVTLRRGDGGLLLEVHDDGCVGETARARRGLASLRSRVAPLGGSAELRRGDTGWVMRVKLPCEQLN